MEPWVEAFLAAVSRGGGADNDGPMVQDPPGSGLYVPDTSQTEG